VIETHHTLEHLNKENEDVNANENKPSPADIAKKFKSVGDAAKNLGEVLKDTGKKTAESAETLKKHFERPEHLTHRPFQHSEALRNLQSSLHRRDNQKHNPKAQRQR
jgi:hypothetical protein